jgi:hypothetical protein
MISEYTLNRQLIDARDDKDKKTIADLYSSGKSKGYRFFCTKCENSCDDFLLKTFKDVLRGTCVNCEMKIQRDRRNKQEIIKMIHVAQNRNIAIHCNNCSEDMRWSVEMMRGRCNSCEYFSTCDFNDNFKKDWFENIPGDKKEKGCCDFFMTERKKHQPMKLSAIETDEYVKRNFGISFSFRN